MFITFTAWLCFGGVGGRPSGADSLLPPSASQGLNWGLVGRAFMWWTTQQRTPNVQRGHGFYEQPQRIKAKRKNNFFPLSQLGCMVSKEACCHILETCLNYMRCSRHIYIQAVQMVHLQIQWEQKVRSYGNIIFPVSFHLRSHRTINNWSIREQGSACLPPRGKLSLQSPFPSRPTGWCVPKLPHVSSPFYVKMSSSSVSADICKLYSAVILGKRWGCRYGCISHMTLQAATLQM